MKYLQYILIVCLLAYVAYNEVDKWRQKERLRSKMSFNQESFAISTPKDFTFCGEKVPLKEPDVWERFDRELHVNVYWHANTYLTLKRANKWFPLMEKILDQEGIPADMKYLVVIESGLLNVVSPANATGFWQFLEATAKEYGLIISQEVDERYDPLKSTKAACKYFKQAYKRLGNWTLVAASYNMGISGVERALVRQKVGSYYDLELYSETSRYIFRAMAFKEIFENPDRYSFDLDSDQLYDYEEIKYVTVDSSIKDLVEFSLQQGINYKLLKLHNPWLRKSSLTIGDTVKSVQIAIPVNPFKDERSQPYTRKDTISEAMKVK